MNTPTECNSCLYLLITGCIIVDSLFKYGSNGFLNLPIHISAVCVKALLVVKGLFIMNSLSRLGL